MWSAGIAKNYAETSVIELQGLSEDVITAMLSCMVWSEKSEGASGVSRDLLQHREMLLETARKVAQVQ